MPYSPGSCGSDTLPINRIIKAVPEFMTFVARGEFQLGVEEVLLATVEDVWQRPVADGRRIVLMP